jgi:peptidoglycan/LPS O-acetylase OafA/YrhL
MKKIPQLDAVRGVAVLLVLVHNSDISPSLHLKLIADNGWMGVDLFFVLSGFLITGILLDTKGTEGYFRNFYARRCLRIWPLYYAALFFMFVIVPVLRPAEAHTVFEARSLPWWGYLVFLQNFLVPIPTSATGLLGVTWSLAVEEQFYLVWPLVVRFTRETRLRNIAIAVICLSPGLRYYLSLHQVNIYSNTFCRLDGLMAGALLAIFLRSRNFAPSRFVTPAWIALLVSAPLALFTDALHARWLAFSFVALAAVSFVYLVLFSTEKTLRAVMTNGFLVFSGTISYGIYLLQKIPLDAARAFRVGGSGSLILLIAAAAVTYALAIASWNLLEKPFLRLKRFFEAGIVRQARLGDPLKDATQAPSY